MQAGTDSSSRSRLFSPWPMAIFALIMVFVLWTIVDTGHAEPDNDQDTTAQKETEKKDSETQKAGTKEKSESNEKSAEEAKDTESDEAKTDKDSQTTREEEPEEEVDIETESIRLMEVFVKMAEAQQIDPDSAESRALSEEFERIQKRLESASEKAKQKYEESLKKRIEAQKPSPQKAQPQPRQIPPAEQRSNLVEEARERLKNSTPPDRTPRLPEPAANDRKSSPIRISEPNEALNAAIQVMSEKDGIQEPAVKVAADKSEAQEENNNVKIKVTNDIVDVDWLLELIGKELKLNYLYPDGDIPKGKIKLHQYGEIPREALLPLLKSVLSASGYTMVKEGPYVKIMKRTSVIQQTDIFYPSQNGQGNRSNESIELQIVDLEHTNFNEVKSFMSRFVPDINIFSDVPNSNSILLVDYSRNMQRNLELIDMIDQPGPSIRLEIIQTRYISISEAKSKVQDLMKTLHSQGGSSQSGQPENEKPTAPARTIVKIDPRTKRPVRVPAPTETPQPSPSAAVSGEKIPTVLEDQRNSRLFVIGTDSQISEFKHLLGYYDVPEPTPDVQFIIFEINYIEVKDAIGQINSLYNAIHQQGGLSSSPPDSTQPEPNSSPQQNPSTPAAKTLAERRSATLPSSQSSRDGPFLMADERMKRFFAVGTSDQISQVTELLSMLDVPAPVDIKLEIMEVKHLVTEDAAKSIGEILKALADEGLEGGVLLPSSSPASSRTSPAPTPGTSDSSRKPTDPRSLPGRSPGGSNEGGYLSVPGGPFIKPDIRTQRLIVVGSESQIQQTRDLLQMLDIPRPGTVVLDLKKVEYVAIDSVMEQISDLLYKLNEGTAPLPADNTGAQLPQLQTTSAQNMYIMCQPFGPFMMADERTKRIIFVGTQEKNDQAIDLLFLLDVPVPDTEIKIAPFVAQYLQADIAAEQITELIEAMTSQEIDQETGAAGAQSPPTPTRQPASASQTSRTQTQSRTEPRRSSQSGFLNSGTQGPYLVPDPRTNRILVVGNDEQIEMVRELMDLLDVDRQLELEVLQIRNVLTSDVAQQLSDLISTLNEQEGASGTTGGISGRRDARSRLEETRSQRQQSPGRSPRSGTTGVGGMIQVEPRGPYMLADERTNRLLVVGSDDQIMQVKDLLVVLDVPPSGYDKMILEIHQPQYVEAVEVVKILDELGITAPDLEDMRPRDRARYQDNRDGGLGPTTEQPRLSAEGEVIPGLEEPEIRVAVQESTNRIFIYATEYQHRDIKEIMDHIDIDPNDALGAIQIYTLENREPSAVADMLTQLLESDQFETNEDQRVRIPGREGAPIIVPLDDIYAIAVRASSKQHKDIQNIIHQLDRRLPQVLVEAHLVTINESGSFDLGVSLKDGTIFDNLDEEGNPRPDAYRLSGTSPFNIGDITTAGSVVSGSGATLAFFTEEFVYATLEALQSSNNGRVISQPRLLVNDNEAGTITSLRSEPTTRTTVTDDSGFASTTFEGYQDAGTTLSITPHISEGGFLQLEIDLSVESFDGNSSDGIPPPKNSNQITTKVTVPNDMVIVLGGLTTQNNGTTVRKVPLLGDIPLIGAAFRSVSQSNTRGSLYVFVKAQIARSIDPDTLEDNFDDLDDLSEDHLIDYKKRKTNYKQQPIIPGIPRKESESDEDIENRFFNRQPDL